MSPPPPPLPPQSCTLSSLIESYIDLLVTYLLLVGSTFFFFGSKLPVPFFSSFLNDIQAFLFFQTRKRIESRHFSRNVPYKDGNRIGSATGRRIIKRRASSYQKEKYFADFGCNSLVKVSEALPSITSSTSRDIYASNLEMELKIKNIEQQLEKAQAENDVLYLELEEERNAAASAADEAMAMIHRLQNEKANIEMELRQYQRIIEDKSFYEEEEMNILKEIIVRRELENHAFEKEFEAYRLIIRNLKPDLLIDSNCDRALMLKGSIESIDKKQTNDDIKNCKLAFQEKDVVTLDNHCESSRFGGSDIKYDKIQCQNRSDFSKFGDDTSVIDVHVIGGEDNLDINENVIKNIDYDHMSAKPSIDFDFTRNSMFKIENRRSKLENDVEILRKRLETIQEVRSNLSSEAFELQRLEEIACQHKEIGEMMEQEHNAQQFS